MGKARNIADIGSHDVIETNSDGVTITGGLSSNDLTVAGNAIATDGSLSNRNKIINGNFDIWQRGTSGTTGYVADRWLANASGSTVAISRQSFTLGQTDVPGEPDYFNRVVVTSSAGANNIAVTQQRIESVKTLAGQTATLSFWAKADASKNMAVEFYQIFGTGGSPSTEVNTIGVTTIALTASWQKFTVTANIPSISGKTLGTNNDDWLGVVFWLDAGSNFDSRTNSLGQQSGTFDIAQVQLEAGDTATPFEHRSYGQELALCQRYFAYYTGANNFFGFGHLNGASQYDSAGSLPVTMRAAPTGSVVSEASLLIKVSGGGVVSVTSGIILSASTTNWRAYGNCGSAGSIGQGVFLFTNSVGPGLQFSAEL